MEPPELDRRIQVFVSKQEDGTFTAHIECEGFDGGYLTKLFELMASLQDERTFLTIPVLPELEMYSFDGVSVTIEQEHRPKTLTMPDSLIPESDSEPPPAGYQVHLAEDGSRVFVRIVK